MTTLMRPQVLLLLSSLVLAGKGATAGELGKMERAASGKSDSSSSSGPRRPSNSSSSSRFYGGQSYGSRSTSTGASNVAAWTIFQNPWLLCVIPPVMGVCLGGNAALAKDPYNGWMYSVNPNNKRSAEFRMGGFFAANKTGIWGSDVDVRGWIYPMFVEARWSTLFENFERNDINTLHVGRLRLGTNIRLGQAGEFATSIGATMLVGAELTPGFNAAANLRVYPYRPLVFAAEGEISVFRNGSPIIEWRAEPGVSFGGFEVRAGVRHIFQPNSISFIGPSLTLSARI